MEMEVGMAGEYNQYEKLSNRSSRVLSDIIINITCREVDNIMKINIKRAYDPPSKGDGVRILVDRLWPRGIAKEKLKLDLWLKDIAPSDTLRQWFSHDRDRWDEFKAHYFEELDANREVVERIIREAGKRPVTLLFSSKELEFNNAVALKEYLERKAKEHVRAA
jgi:uncharacterized protein YeaO (DUF488 family)